MASHFDLPELLNYRGIFL